MALTLSPAGYQKVLAAQQQRRTAAPRPQTTQPQQPSDFTKSLGAAGSITNMLKGLTQGTSVQGLARGGSSILNALKAYQSFQQGKPLPGAFQAASSASDALQALPAGMQSALKSQIGMTGTQAGQGIGTLAGLANAGLLFSQGKYLPGSVAAAQGLGSGAQLAAQVAPNIVPSAVGAAGGVLGGLGGLAGAGFAASQGDPVGAMIGGLQGAAGLAALAPASWTIGGIPIAASGAAGAGAAAGGGAAGAGAAGVAGGASLVGGLTGVGTVLALGPIIDYFAKMISRDKGRLIPEGASSAKTPTSFKSAQTGRNLSDSLVRGAGDMDFRQLLGMAAVPLAPNAEMMFKHDRAGLGESTYNTDHGGQYTRMSPEYQALLEGVQRGDLASIEDFITGINVYTGETGATKADWNATDQYRRSFVDKLPPQMQEVLRRNPNLFQAIHDDWKPLDEQELGNLTNAYKRRQVTGDQFDAQMQALEKRLNNAMKVRNEHYEGRASKDLAKQLMQGVNDPGTGNKISAMDMLQDPYYQTLLPHVGLQAFMGPEDLYAYQLKQAEMANQNG